MLLLVLTGVTLEDVESTLQYYSRLPPPGKLLLHLVFAIIATEIGSKFCYTVTLRHCVLMVEGCSN